LKGIVYDFEEEKLEFEMTFFTVLPVAFIPVALWLPTRHSVLGKMICMSAGEGGPKWGAHVWHAKRHKVCRTFALFCLTIEVSVLLLSSRRYGCAFGKCKWFFARTSRPAKHKKKQKTN